MKIFRKLRYKPEIEYWVHLRDITIPDEFRKHKVGRDKWRSKCYYFKRFGIFESTIVLDYDFNLLDGYSSFLIAEKNDLGKVPVIFREKVDK